MRINRKLLALKNEQGKKEKYKDIMCNIIEFPKNPTMDIRKKLKQKKSQISIQKTSRRKVRK